MNYHLETIPVWDAYGQSNQCPLCHLHQKKEADYVNNFLGGSVMKPDTRIEVNEKGFCTNHFQKLYTANNRLGLALMTHTHMKENMHQLLDRDLDMLISANRAETRPSLFAFNKKKSPLLAAIRSTQKRAQKLQHQCILCERLDRTMDQYIYTVTYLYEHESSFRRTFSDSNGFCLPHLSQVLHMAYTHMNPHIRTDFISEIARVQKEQVQNLEDELFWFTQKFDHENKDKPWGNAKNALPRMINFLKGPILPVNIKMLPEDDE